MFELAFHQVLRHKIYRFIQSVNREKERERERHKEMTRNKIKRLKAVQMHSICNINTKSLSSFYFIILDLYNRSFSSDFIKRIH